MLPLHVVPGSCRTITGWVRRRGLLLLIGYLTLTFQGCSCESSTEETPPDPVAQSVTVVAQGEPFLRIDQTLDVTARATASNGAAVSATFSWSTSNPSVATVTPLADGRARVTALAIGDAMITATVSGLSVQGSISIATLPPALSEIRILPVDVSVFPDGMVELTAEPIKVSDGSVADVTLTWMSSDLAVATVTTNPTSSRDAVVVGVTEGMATISAVEPSQPTVIGNAEVTVEPPKGIIQGILYDKDDVTPLDGYPLVLTGATPGTTRTGMQNPGDPVPVPSGGYRFEVEPGSYSVSVSGVVGNRFIQTAGSGTVAEGETTVVDLSETTGYHLNMLSGDLGTFNATAGATVNLQLTFQAWNRIGCPGCVPSVAIGVDGDAINVYRYGGPVGVFPGMTRTVTVPIVAPAQGGSIYAMLVVTSTAAGIQPGLDLYENYWSQNVDIFIKIGTLVVN